MKKYIILLGPIIFLFISFKEAYLAQQYAELSNLNFEQAISLWGSEKEAQTTFSAYELGTILRIDRAIYSFIIFCMWSYFSYTQHIQMNIKPNK